MILSKQTFLKEINDFVSFIHHERETDLQAEIVTTWRKDEDHFVLTQACKNVQKQLERNNIVTITGVSGSGKSGIAHHIALALGEQGYEIYPVDRADDIKKYGDVNSNQVFVLDDPVGGHVVDWNELSQFEKIHKAITSLANNNNYGNRVPPIATGDVKLLLTCRKNILNNERFSSYNTIVGMGLVDLSSEENCLNAEEKKRMFDCYAKQVSISATIKESIVMKSYPNFPLLCKVFGANSAEFGKQPIKYFSEPFSVLLEELNTIKQRDKYQHCALLLCLIFENSFDVNSLNVVSETFKKTKKLINQIMSICGISENRLQKIEQAFKSFIGVYFIQEDTRFRFIHDTLFDVVAYQFGTDYPCEMLKYCKSSFIREHVRTACVKPDDSLVIRIKEEHYGELTKRLYSDLNNGNFDDVFLNPSLGDRHFVEAFCRSTRTMKSNEILKVYFRTCPNLQQYDSSHEFRWNKDWLYRYFLENQNTRAIHWVMAFNMFDIFCACHSVLKTFKKLPDWKDKFPIFKTVVSGTSDQIGLIPMVCLSGNVDMLNILLQDNLEVNGTSVWGWGHWNALHMAIISGDIHMVRMVVNMNIDINSSVQGIGCTSLFYAAALGYTYVCNYILQCGANVNHCDNDDESPLNVSSQEGHTNTVSVLLQNGANVNHSNRNGDSPLFNAAKNGHTDTVSVLLQNGADINLCNSNGDSPLHIATLKGHVNTVSVLLRNDAVINLCNSNGDCSLHVAAREGNSDIASILLHNGADNDRCNRNGFSPLDIAFSGRHSEIVSVLLNSGGTPQCLAAYY